MNVIIIVAGVAGLCVAAYALFELALDAGRRRQPVDIVLAVAVAALAVWVLLAFGDRLLR
jgi:uncharacterized membrane-anchored protein